MQPNITTTATNPTRAAAAEQAIAAALIAMLAELRPGLRLALETLISHQFARADLLKVLDSLQLGPATRAAALATIDHLLTRPIREA